MQNTTNFIAACCAWPRTAQAEQRTADSIQAISNWDRAAECIAHHRVEPLIHSAINQHKHAIPDDFCANLKRKALAVSVRSMGQAKETVRLHALLINAGIDAVQFKGAGLGQMAYGSVAMKSASDIDMYVPAAQAMIALEAMEKEGYRYALTNKLMSPSLKKTLVRLRKDAPMMDKHGLRVELHWKFSGFPGLLTDYEKSFNKVNVDISGFGAVQTIECNDLLIYLCVHGAIHNWHRLKWLADVNAFFNRLSLDAQLQAINHANTKGAGVAVSQALQLCRYYFHTPLPEVDFADAQSLISLSRKEIEASAVPNTSYEKFMSHAKNLTVLWRLFEPKTKAIGLLHPRMISTEDIIFCPLPKSLDWLYILMRIPALIVRQCVKVLRRVSG